MALDMRVSRKVLMEVSGGSYIMAWRTTSKVGQREPFARSNSHGTQRLVGLCFHDLGLDRLRYRVVRSDFEKRDDGVQHDQDEEHRLIRYYVYMDIPRGWLQSIIHPYMGLLSQVMVVLGLLLFSYLLGSLVGLVLLTPCLITAMVTTYR